MNNEVHKITSSVSDESRSGGFQGSKESGPHVGLFYIVDGKLYWEGMSAAHASTSAYVKTYAKKHYAYWENHLLRLLPDLREYNWDHFPRGRVVFDTEKDIYELLADKCILKNSELIEKIMAEMGLPASKVKISWDVQYECAVCKSIYLRKNSMGGIWLTGDSCFVRTRDGRRLWFPWGPILGRRLGSGYIVASEPDFKRLHKQMRMWMRASVAFILGMSPWVHMLAVRFTGNPSTGSSMVAVFLLFVLVCFSVWVYSQCHGLERTKEKPES